ncbi:hypothetical protein ALC62_08495, partial [Cyphomyrmex costatus]
RAAFVPPATEWLTCPALYGEINVITCSEISNPIAVRNASIKFNNVVKASRVPTQPAASSNNSYPSLRHAPSRSPSVVRECDGRAH